MITSQGKISNTLIDKVLPVVREGNYPEIACQSIGVSHQTFYNWLNRGEAIYHSIDNPVNESDVELTERDALYLRFFIEVKRAEAEAEISDIREINKGEKNAIPRLAKLSRRHPSRWADRRDDSDRIKEGLIFLTELKEALQRPQQQLDSGLE